MGNLPPSRELNLLETPWGLVEKSGYAANGAIVVKVEGPVDGPMLRRALDLLQQGHAALRVGITRNRSRPGLAPLDTEAGVRPISLTVLPLMGGDPAIAIVEDLAAPIF